MKKIFAMVLALLLTVNELTLSATCAEQQKETLNINSCLLDAMLYGGRHWVIETLVEDSRKNNPLAIVQRRSGQKSLARDAIDRYNGIDVGSATNEGIYKGLVWTMEKVYNADEYIRGRMDDAGNLIGAATELFSGPDDLKTTVNDITTTTDEIRYDRLLKAVLTEEYIASNGVKAGSAESDLIYVRQVKDAAEYFNSFINMANTSIGTLVGMEDAEQFTLEYITDYAVPYRDAAERLLESIGTLSGTNGGAESEGNIELLASLASLEAYSFLKPRESFAGFSYQEYLSDHMVESGVKSMFEGLGAVLDIQETALDSYLYVNSLQRQRETIVGPLQRIAKSTNDGAMRSSIEYAANMMDESYQNEMLDYSAIVRYLRSEETVNKTLAKLAMSALKKCSFLSADSLGGAVIAKATSIAKITEVVADKALGLKETCKKTYELIYLEDLIDAAIYQYQCDVADYEKSRTETMAGAVLDDLLFLQRLRLYGEKVAYGLWAGQADSWIGKLFLNGFDPKSYERLYQCSVDELICASVMPTLEGLEVKAGEVCTIQYMDGVGYYATVRPEDSETTGRKFIDIEAASRLAIGAEVNGTLTVQAVDAQVLRLGYLNTSGSTTIGVINGVMQIDELTQEGENLTLVTDLGGSIACDQMTVGSCEYAPRDGSRLSVGNLTVNGTLTGGDVTVAGDLSGSNGSIGSTLTLNGTRKQKVSGTLNVKNLEFSGTQIAMDGKLTVTDTLYGGTTEVIKGKNLVLSGGKLLGDSFCGELSATNATFANQRIQGILYNKGGVTCLGNVTVGGLVSTGALSMSDSGVLTVNGDLKLQTGGTLLGGKVIAKSDVYVAEQTEIGRLDLKSKAKQTLSGNVVIDELYVDCLGADMQGTVTVRKLLDYQSGTITGKEIYLADEAVIQNNRFIGSLSLLNWAPEKQGNITGSITLRDGGSITGNAAVTGTLTAAGSAVINGTISAGKLKSASSLTMEDGSVLTVQGQASLGGVLTGGELKVCEDLFVNGLTASSEVCVRGDVDVSGNTSFAALRLDGRLPQKITGSNFTVDRLELSNTSGKLLDVKQVITVREKLTNDGVSVKKGAIRSAAIELPADGDMVYPGDLTFSSDQTFTGSHVVIQGDLNLSNAKLALTGTSLEVRGKLVTSGGALALDKDSVVLVAGRASLSNTPVTLDGTLTVLNDLVLSSSSAVTGSGALCLRGDLLSTCAVTIGTLRLDGLTRQYLNSSAKVVAEGITFDNPSRGGVVLQSVINYMQNVELNGTSVFGGGKLKKEAA